MAQRPKQPREQGIPRGGSGVMREARDEKLAQIIGDKSKAKKRARDVRIYDAWIKHAQNEQDAYNQEFQRNMDGYVGALENEATKDMLGMPYIASEDILSVNRIMPALRTTNAAIMFKMPWFTLRSRRPLDDEDSANLRIGEQALNYTLQTPRDAFLRTSRLVVLAAELGLGGAKVTYTPVDEGYEDDSNKEPSYGKMELTVGEDGSERIEVKGGIPLLDASGNLQVRKGNRILLDNRRVADLYKVDYVDFRDCVFDPEGTNDFLDHRRFARRRCWTYEAFKDNKMFTNKQDILESVRYLDENYSGNEFFGGSAQKRLGRGTRRVSMYNYRPTDASKSDMARIWGWEVWDFEKRVVAYLVDDYDKLVGAEPIPGYVGHSPFEWLKFNEVLSEWMPYPDVTAARPLVRAYNRSRSQRLTHQGRAVRKIEARKGEIDQANMEALKNGEDMTVIFTKTGAALKPIDMAPLEPSVYDDDRNIADMSEIMSSSPEARGSSQSGTATQAAIVENRGTLGEEDKRRLVAGFLAGCATKTYNVLQATLDTNLAVSIVGKDGNLWQQAVSPEQIVPDCEAVVDVVDLRPHDDAREVADSQGVLQILGPAAFLSDKFNEWFWKARRVDDPDLRAELQMVAFNLAMGGLGGGDGGGDGAEAGGPKPPDPGAKEQGKTYEGRAHGRALRPKGPEGGGES